MKYRLRPDVQIYPADDEGGSEYLVRDPRTGEAFQLDEVEQFLLSSLQQTQAAQELAQAASTRFSIEVTGAAVSAFLQMVREWGLLEPVDATDPIADAETAERTEPVDLPAELNVDEADERVPVTTAVFQEEHAGVAAEPPGRRARANQRGRATPGGAFNDKSHVTFFDPDRFFRTFSWTAWFFRSPIAWLLVPALSLAMLVVYYSLPELTHDLALYRRPLTLFQRIIIALFTIHLTGQLSQGAALAQHGIRVSSFGIRFAMGLIPRFDLKADPVDDLPRADRIRVFAAPLLMRLWLISLCIAGWSALRGSGTESATYLLTIGFISVVSLFFAGNPLMKGPGYRTLTAVLDQPLLRQKANRALFRRDVGSVDDDSNENQLALKTYALASIIFLITFLGLLGAYVARSLELHYQGTGVVLFLLLLLYLVLRFRRQIMARREQREQRRARHPRANAPRSADAAPTNNARKQRGRRTQTGQNTKRRRPWLRYVFLLAFVCVLPLPYSYETGGPAEVLGAKEFEIYADEAGTIDEVFFDGGEWIPKDTILARMSAYSEHKNVATTEAAILKQQAELAKLRSTPRQEQVALAEQELLTATVRARYSAETVTRLTPLFKKGNVSLEDYADAESARDLDQAREAEARSNLALVRSGVHPMDLAAAEAELKRLQAQLLYDKEKLERTALRTAIYGRPIGLNLTQAVGRFLDRGDLFTRMIDDRSVRVEIAIPESDIGDVVIGKQSRVRVWAFPQRTFVGAVEEIAPAVEEESFGGIVRVVVSIPNENGLLKSGMSGFGKVAAGEKPVFVAFTRALVRFFLVEVWSWVP